MEALKRKAVSFSANLPSKKRYPGETLGTERGVIPFAAGLGYNKGGLTSGSAPDSQFNVNREFLQMLNQGNASEAGVAHVRGAPRAMNTQMPVSSDLTTMSMVVGQTVTILISNSQDISDPELNGFLTRDVCTVMPMGPDVRNFVVEAIKFRGTPGRIGEFSGTGRTFHVEESREVIDIDTIGCSIPTGVIARRIKAGEELYQYFSQIAYVSIMKAIEARIVNALLAVPTPWAGSTINAGVFSSPTWLQVMRPLMDTLGIFNNPDENILTKVVRNILVSGSAELKARKNLFIGSERMTLVLNQFSKNNSFWIRGQEGVDQSNTGSSFVTGPSTSSALQGMTFHTVRMNADEANSTSSILAARSTFRELWEQQQLDDSDTPIGIERGFVSLNTDRLVTLQSMLTGSKEIFFGPDGYWFGPDQLPADTTASAEMTALKSMFPHVYAHLEDDDAGFLETIKKSPFYNGQNKIKRFHQISGTQMSPSSLSSFAGKLVSGIFGDAASELGNSLVTIRADLLKWRSYDEKTHINSTDSYSKVAAEHLVGNPSIIADPYMPFFPSYLGYRRYHSNPNRPLFSHMNAFDRVVSTIQRMLRTELDSDILYSIRTSASISRDLESFLWNEILLGDDDFMVAFCGNEAEVFPKGKNVSLSNGEVTALPPLAFQVKAITKGKYYETTDANGKQTVLELDFSTSLVGRIVGSDPYDANIYVGKKASKVYLPPDTSEKFWWSASANTKAGQLTKRETNPDPSDDWMEVKLGEFFFHSEAEVKAGTPVFNLREAVKANSTTRLVKLHDGEFNIFEDDWITLDMRKPCYSNKSKNNPTAIKDLILFDRLSDLKAAGSSQFGNLAQLPYSPLEAITALGFLLAKSDYGTLHRMLQAKLPIPYRAHLSWSTTVDAETALVIVDKNQTVVAGMGEIKSMEGRDASTKTQNLNFDCRMAVGVTNVNNAGKLEMALWTDMSGDAYSFAGKGSVELDSIGRAGMIVGWMGYDELVKDRRTQDDACRPLFNRHFLMSWQSKSSNIAPGIPLGCWPWIMQNYFSDPPDLRASEERRLVKAGLGLHWPITTAVPGSVIVHYSKGEKKKEEHKFYFSPKTSFGTVRTNRLGDGSS